MISDEIYEALQRANRELLKAENELSRQYSASTKLAACASVLKAMKQIMRLYLVANSVSIPENAELPALLKMCTNKHAAFAALDLTSVDNQEPDPVNNVHSSSFVIEHVGNYVAVANQLKSIVWESLKI